LPGKQLLGELRIVPGDFQILEDYGEAKGGRPLR